MEERFMREVLALAAENARSGRGGPFAALVVQGARVIARGTSLVASTHDPTAHAEIVAIRKACEVLGDVRLTGCDLYTVAEPCVMCLGAIYWAQPTRIFYGVSRPEASGVGRDDGMLYEDLPRDPADRRIPMVRLLGEEARQVLSIQPDAGQPRP